MSRLTPAKVHETLRRRIAFGGLDLVCDFAKSRDGYLADARDGRRYLDFHGFHGTAPLGYNHPGLADGATLHALGRAAVHRPSHAEFATLELARFVDLFGELAQPEALPHLALVADPSAAVDAALRAACDWTSRRGSGRAAADGVEPKVVYFRQAHHGSSGLGLALTNTVDEGPPPGCRRPEWPRIANPHARFPLEGAHLRDTEDREIQAVADVRSALREHGGAIAAVIVEPIQGEGGDNHFRPEFLRELRRACDEFEALLVFDERGTGGAATGRYWCWQALDVAPDVLVFGGRVGAAGLLGSARFEEVDANPFADPARFGRAGASLVDLVRAARILEIVSSEGLEANALEMGATLLGGLRSLAEQDDRLTNVRGRGLIAAFDVPSGDIRDRLVAALRGKGLLTLTGGLRSIRLRPALSIKKAEIEHALDLLHDVLKATK